MNAQVKPVLIDLYCGAGGATKGYQRAGFYVVGVDINPQPHYCGDDFILGDCLELGPDILRLADAVHASPPCGRYTRKPSRFGRTRVHFLEHPDLIGPTRAMLGDCGLPYAIENVAGSPMRSDVMLCGSMFGLRIIKHRHFELNFVPAYLLPPCNHLGAYYPFQGEGRSAAEHREAQGTPWIPMHGGRCRKAGRTGDLNNAIPPAFTEWLGGHLMEQVEGRRVAL